MHAPTTEVLELYRALRAGKLSIEHLATLRTLLVRAADRAPQAQHDRLRVELHAELKVSRAARTIRAGTGRTPTLARSWWPQEIRSVSGAVVAIIAAHGNTPADHCAAAIHILEAASIAFESLDPLGIDAAGRRAA